MLMQLFQLLNNQFASVYKQVGEAQLEISSDRVNLSLETVSD